jgi:hypothetical protein
MWLRGLAIEFAQPHHFVAIAALPARVLKEQ